MSARTIIINTGAVAAVAPVEGLRESSRLVTNVELLRTVDLPGRLVVIGGGYVGLEFAASYRALGSEVTVLEGGPFLPREDERVSAAVRELLVGDGVTIVTAATVARSRTARTRRWCPIWSTARRWTWTQTWCWPRRVVARPPTTSVLTWPESRWGRAARWRSTSSFRPANPTCTRWGT